MLFTENLTWPISKKEFWKEVWSWWFIFWLVESREIPDLFLAIKLTIKKELSHFSILSCFFDTLYFIGILMYLFDTSTLFSLIDVFRVSILLFWMYFDPTSVPNNILSEFSIPFVMSPLTWLDMFALKLFLVFLFICKFWSIWTAPVFFPTSKSFVMSLIEKEVFLIIDFPKAFDFIPFKEILGVIATSIFSILYLI